MKAAIFHQFNEDLTVCEVPDPACPRQGVIVKVQACGVCRSDWHAWKGADPDVVPPHVPGHEFAGIVDEVGPECRNFRLGERVTAPFIISCGTCEDCRVGDPTICNTQHVLGFSGFGAFAERIAIPRADFNLVHLPDELDFVTAAGMGCRVSTAFRALTDRARLQSGEWLAVHGCGGVGLSAVMIGVALGARVIAIDVNDAALRLALQSGAAKAINAADANSVGQTVRAATDGGAHVSLDALGITETFHNSISGLRKLGRHVQIGMPVGPNANPDIPLLDSVYMRQISVMGTRGIAARRLPDLLQLVTSGRIDPARMITRRLSLSEAGDALAEMDHYSSTGVAVIDRF